MLPSPGTEEVDATHHREALRQGFRFFCGIRCVHVSILGEDELFRIDHYLGKEVVLNLSTLRFAEPLFEPTWNATCIESVEITFKEDIPLLRRLRCGLSVISFNFST